MAAELIPDEQSGRPFKIPNGIEWEGKRNPGGHKVTVKTDEKGFSWSTRAVADARVGCMPNEFGEQQSLGVEGGRLVARPE